MNLLLLALIACSSGDLPLEASCSDGRDNDGDGLVDCEDGDCATTHACLEEDCEDGLDNDSDGYGDCQDEDCWGGGVCPVVRSRVLGGEMTHQRDYKQSTGFLSAGQVTFLDTTWRTSVQLNDIYGTAMVWHPAVESWQRCSWSFHAGTFQRYSRQSAWYSPWDSGASGVTSSSFTRADFAIESGCTVTAVGLLLPQQLRAAGSQVTVAGLPRYLGLVQSHTMDQRSDNNAFGDAGWSDNTTSTERWRTNPLFPGGTWTFGYEPGAAR